MSVPDPSQLMGEVIDDPQNQPKDVEFLLTQLLQSLLSEQKLKPRPGIQSKDQMMNEERA